MSASILNVHPTPGELVPHVKRAPIIPTLFVHTYASSDDGTDENLLILLHGLGELTLLFLAGQYMLRRDHLCSGLHSSLGDTHLPFTKLGKQLRLPQTATLSLRAPERVPYLDEEAYQWYESFNDLGELLERPNPTPALDKLEELAGHLVHVCHWPPNRIHLFGFGQGGGLVAEFALRWWKTHGSTPHFQLASVVSIGGPLLSYPTLSSPCPTPALVFYRPTSEATTLSAFDLTAFKKGFNNVNEIKGGIGEGMPRSKEEWEKIMRFWSQRLSRRQVDGLYEVLSSGTE